MKKDEAPQDNIAMYQGGRKALYAVADEGKFEIMQSSGWNVEEVATLQAIDEFQRLEIEAYKEFQEGKLSPLGVWMYRRRMSLATLSQCTGFWQWQVKRHLNVHVFNALSPQKIALYCDVLDVMPEELRHPKEPQ
ncbi:MAG: helix-turn-helix domain-containing protein [Sulfuricurvum sp.]|nr:helix-turn-helix domain-containing protein [Sulfuricurvum sp.]MDD5385570.1 helix-turn-helix domain-containing protein [Sulfuricurvum sp.]